MRNAYTLPSKTFTDLQQPDIYHPFMRGYFKLLQSSLKPIKIIDLQGNVKEIRYSCGQDHDRRNPNWKPFQYLERYCRKRGYNDFEALDVIEAQIGRRLKCECELLGG